MCKYYVQATGFNELKYCGRTPDRSQIKLHTCSWKPWYYEIKVADKYSKVELNIQNIRTQKKEKSQSYTFVKYVERHMRTQLFTHTTSYTLIHL